MLAPLGITQLDQNSLCVSQDRSDPWTTVFPSVYPSQVEIISDDPQYVLHDEPTRVRLNGQKLFYKSLQLAGEALGKREIEKYEQIERAKLYTYARISRLSATVQDENCQLVGLLLHPIDEEGTLADALETAPSEIEKKRWAK